MDVLRYKNCRFAILPHDINHSCRARIFFMYNIACNIWQHDKYFAAAVVDLERTFYQVSVGVGVVEVCAIVYNPSGAYPITFPFNVALSTSEDAVANRAGNIESSVYYIYYPLNTCIPIAMVDFLLTG